MIALDKTTQYFTDLLVGETLFDNRANILPVDRFFNKGLTGAGRRLGSFVGGIARGATKLLAFGGALAGIGGAAAFGALVKSSFATIDALAKTADKLGVSTQALVGLRHAGELAGLSQQNLDTSLEKMTLRISEVADGAARPPTRCAS